MLMPSDPLVEREINKPLAPVIKRVVQDYQRTHPQ